MLKFGKLTGEKSRGNKKSEKGGADENLNSEESERRMNSLLI